MVKFSFQMRKSMLLISTRRWWGSIPLPLAEHAPLGGYSPYCTVHHLLRLPRSVIASDATRSASSAWDCWWMLPPRRIHHADPQPLPNTRRKRRAQALLLLKGCFQAQPADDQKRFSIPA
jgi:hypothetical protein